MRKNAYIRENAIRAYQSGTPVKEICERFRISNVSLFRWLKLAGHRPNRAQPAERPLYVDEIAPVTRAFLDHTGWFRSEDEPAPTTPLLERATAWWATHDAANCKRCIGMSGHPSYPTVTA